VRGRSLLGGGALLAGAAAVGWAAMSTDGGRESDERVFKAANRGHGEATDRLFSGVTELGSMWAAAGAAAVLALAGRRREAARALSAAGATWLLGQAAKKIVQRPRPYEADPDGTRTMIAPPHGASWPSSHPAVLTSFVTVAARELGLGPAARGGLAGLAAAVATSRVYLGVHYPSDVASGLLMGRAVAAVWPRGRG
jgi:membrane-associated phospholipid phosphatase